LHYSQALDNPANAKFSRAFEASAGKIASYYSEATYTNARWIVEAIKAVGGKAEDRDALLAALRRVDLKESARGPLKVDDFGNPIQNIYIRKVERVGGKLQNTVIATYPGVSVLHNCRLAVQALTAAKFAMHRPLARDAVLRARAEETLAAVGLADRAAATVRNLSHGEQRQLEIGLALAGRPRLLLLDEP